MGDEEDHIKNEEDHSNVLCVCLSLILKVLCLVCTPSSFASFHILMHDVLSYAIAHACVGCRLLEKCAWSYHRAFILFTTHYHLGGSVSAKRNYTA